MNILIAGFQHETNTFAPTRADWAAFLRGDSFPAYEEGPAMLTRFTGSSLPAGGFIAEAQARGWQLLPSCWAGATPSAQVTREAFERIAGTIAEATRSALAGPGLDAIYLDLHGAAVAEHVDDAEGELLARLRALVGPELPIVASLDLHANVTQRMLELADALVAYRTYPHVDTEATGRLAAQLLKRRIARGAREPVAARRIPFLIPINAGCTMIEPAGAVYRSLPELDARYGTVASVAMGFPAADFPECGPMVWAYGDAAQAVADALYADICEQAARWRVATWTPDDAVAEALELAATAARPVVIADTQDNPGAGADSNTTGMLHALLRAGAGRRFPQQVALGLLYDPEAAAAAHAAGQGARLRLALGRSVPTWSGQWSDSPVEAECTVRALHEGAVVLQGPMMTGVRVRLGPCACLDVEGVLVVVASGKKQMLDRALYRCVGIEPERMKILVNKSSVHFRADFAPIAQQILVARAPGPMSADPSDLPWTRLAASTSPRVPD
ncbi:M81 family metallopeptidase [Variovorax paradoxus]|nr:M81 family metallopeptidase [Variovorax paradoxus]MBT2299900.1 M81 family metallopeptidase [Variovorax paradoxus]